MVDWKALIGEALTQALRIFLPVAVALVMKWAAEIWLKIKGEKPNLARALETAAQIGYCAAEEHFRDDDEVTGEGKMAYAISKAEEYIFETTGIHIDLDVIRSAIAEYGINSYGFSWYVEKIKK